MSHYLDMLRLLGSTEVASSVPFAGIADRIRPLIGSPVPVQVYLCPKCRLSWSAALRPGPLANQCPFECDRASIDHSPD